MVYGRFWKLNCVGKNGKALDAFEQENDRLKGVVTKFTGQPGVLEVNP